MNHRPIGESTVADETLARGGVWGSEGASAILRFARTALRGGEFRAGKTRDDNKLIRNTIRMREPGLAAVNASTAACVFKTDATFGLYDCEGESVYYTDWCICTRRKPSPPCTIPHHLSVGLHCCKGRRVSSLRPARVLPKRLLLRYIIVSTTQRTLTIRAVYTSCTRYNIPTVANLYLPNLCPTNNYFSCVRNRMIRFHW